MNANSAFRFSSFRNCYNDIEIDALDSTTILSLLIFCIVAIRPFFFATIYNVPWIYGSPDACNRFISLSYSVSNLHQCLFDKLL